MGKRVLLIEDEPNIIEAIRFILSRDGWRVDTHSDGVTRAGGDPGAGARSGDPRRDAAEPVGI